MVRLDLRYQYSGVPRGTHSVLEVKLNGSHIGSIKLSPELDANAVHHDGIGLPAQGLHPYSNTLTFEFVFDATNRASSGQAQFAAIMRDSRIDLRGYSHLAVMPKLELFSEAGFPFTRHPDLSGTAVVMPSEPSAAELELYLGAMGYFGAQTGLPALLVTVASPTQLEAVRDKAAGNWKPRRSIAFSGLGGEHAHRSHRIGLAARCRTCLVAFAFSRVSPEGF
jgi:cellulose synthase (UDP-forming)